MSPSFWQDTAVSLTGVGQGGNCQLSPSSEKNFQGTQLKAEKWQTPVELSYSTEAVTCFSATDSESLSTDQGI